MTDNDLKAIRKRIDSRQTLLKGEAQLLLAAFDALLARLTAVQQERDQLKAQQEAMTARSKGPA